MINALKHWASKLPEEQKIYLRLLLIGGQYNLKESLNLFRFSKSKLKSTSLSYIPPVYAIPITRKCNLRCPTCYYWLGNAQERGGNINPEQLKTVLNTSGRVLIISLTGGEPLLHPRFGEIVNICKQSGAKVHISTNGTLIKHHLPELQKCDQVNISLDSYDEESFKINRGGTPEQFKNILGGLNFLQGYQLSFLLSKENVHEARKMLAFAETLRPKLVYFHNINPHGSDRYHSLDRNDPEVREVLQGITKRTDYPFDIQISTIFDVSSGTFKTVKCTQAWYFHCFDYTGNISRCCHLEPDGKLGNVFRGDDFNSVGMQAIREKIAAQTEETNPACVYCQRRFTELYGNFVASDQRWYLNQSKERERG